MPPNATRDEFGAKSLMAVTIEAGGRPAGRVLLVNEDTGETFRAKVPTTPVNQAAAVLDGIERVCAIAGIKPSALTELMHGTTVTTNAVLEGKGARVGLVTTEGYRQILQVARSYVPGGLAGWIIWPKPEPLASLEDTVATIARFADAIDVIALPRLAAGASDHAAFTRLAGLIG